MRALSSASHPAATRADHPGSVRSRAVAVLAGLAGLGAAATGYGLAAATRDGPADRAVPPVISVPAPETASPGPPPATASSPAPAPAPRTPRPEVVDPPPAVDVAPPGDDDDDDSPDDGDDDD